MDSFEKDFFASNRRRLFELLPDRSAVLLNASTLKTRSWDSHYPFCQDRNFYYLTGYENRSAAILLKKNGNNLNCTLFVIQLTPLQIHWNGYLPGPEEVRDITGIESVTTIDNLFQQLGTLSTNTDCLYLDFLPVPPYSPLTETLQLADEIRRTNPHVEIRRAHTLLAGLREVKRPIEIERIRKAVDLTREGITGFLKYIGPDQPEYAIDARFTYELQKRRCQPAFQTIIASGENATILHYTALDRTMQDGELVLTDLGAEFRLYSADITRTFPVNGKFSEEQRQLYELVLEANERTIEAVKPGMTFQGLNDVTRNILAEGMKKLGRINDLKDISRYYTHGVAHSLGLDTHDIMSGTQQTLVPGMVLTIEPGLYIPENRIGIRIEDDVVVTENGAENLSNGIPKKPDDIERWMSECRSA